MFDSDEITSILVLVTDGNEVFAFDAELVESNLLQITSGPKQVKINVKFVDWNQKEQDGTRKKSG